MKIHEFRKYIDNPAILEHISSIILKRLAPAPLSGVKEPTLTLKDVASLLSNPMDKYLFVMFRD